MSSARLFLYASNVAACIGKNKYKHPHDVLESVWKRVDPRGFGEALERHNVVDVADRLASLVVMNPGVEKAVSAAENTIPQTSAETSRAVDAIPIPAALSKEDSKIVRDAVRETVFTRYGTRKEDDVFDYIKKELAFDVVKDASLYSVKLGEHRGTEYHVCGRVDGVSEDKTRVIEIKNRVHRLFGSIPEYEKLQLQTYMHLVPNAEKSVLVECVRSAGGSLALNVMEMDKDDLLWTDEIVPKLKIFAEYLIELMQSAEAQNAYFAQKNRSKAVRTKMIF